MCAAFLFRGTDISVESLFAFPVAVAAAVVGFIVIVGSI
jgi:hypothetical protein